jgi:hypothetical protein
MSEILYTEEEAQDEDLSDLLLWMRIVMRFPHEPRRLDAADEKLRPLRKLYKEDYAGFLDRMSQLERAYQAARDKRREREAAEANRLRQEAKAAQEPRESSAPGEVWDGKGACPVCGHEKPVDRGRPYYLQQLDALIGQ